MLDRGRGAGRGSRGSSRWRRRSWRRRAWRDRRRLFFWLASDGCLSKGADAERQRSVDEGQRLLLSLGGVVEPEEQHAYVKHPEYLRRDPGIGAPATGGRRFRDELF